MEAFFMSNVGLLVKSTGQYITDPWYSLNIARVVWVAFDLLPQVIDVRLDQRTIAVTKSPDMGHNLAGCTHIIGVGGQQVHKFTFYGRQADGFAMDTDFIVEGIDAQWPDRDPRRRRHLDRRTCSAAYGMNARKQLIR